MNNAGVPAYPTDLISKYSSVNSARKDKQPSIGLTKREKFALAAMQGCLAADGECICEPEPTAKEAVKFADALLKALEE